MSEGVCVGGGGLQDTSVIRDTSVTCISRAEYVTFDVLVVTNCHVFISAQTLWTEWNTAYKRDKWHHSLVCSQILAVFIIYTI